MTLYTLLNFEEKKYIDPEIYSLNSSILNFF